MQWSYRLVTLTSIVLLSSSLNVAQAQCALPYTISNGQSTDATKLMGNFNALINCLNPGGATNAVQYNAGGGNLGSVGPMTNGQVVIGSAGNAPQTQTLTAGTGIVITNGPGNITIAATAGTNVPGLYSPVTSATPTATGTGLVGWLNQGSATVSDTVVGVSIDAPSSGTSVNITGRTMLAPTAPYTIKALIAATHDSNNYGSVGIGWYDGSAKLHLMAYSLNNGAAPYFLVQRWNSTSSFNSTDFSSNPNDFAQPIWLQVKDDGTNVSFAFSHDGANFLTVYSVAKSSGFLGAGGYSNVIFFCDPRGGRTIGTVMSWTQS
jgi:hypothetical protein